MPAKAWSPSPELARRVVTGQRFPPPARAGPASCSSGLRSGLPPFSGGAISSSCSQRSNCRRQAPSPPPAGRIDVPAESGADGVDQPQQVDRQPRFAFEGLFEVAGIGVAATRLIRRMMPSCELESWRPLMIVGRAVDSPGRAGSRCHGRRSSDPAFRPFPQSSRIGSRNGPPARSASASPAACVDLDDVDQRQQRRGKRRDAGQASARRSRGRAATGSARGASSGGCTKSSSRMTLVVGSSSTHRRE